MLKMCDYCKAMEKLGFPVYVCIGNEMKVKRTKVKSEDLIPKNK